MVQLRDDLEKFKALNSQVVGISYDAVPVLKTFSDAQSIPFPLLSDEGSKTIQAFDLHFQRGLPHPGTVLIDQGGVIRAKLFQEGYQTRHTTDELVAAAEKLK